VKQYIYTPSEACKQCTGGDKRLFWPSCGLYHEASPGIPPIRRHTAKSSSLEAFRRIIFCEGASFQVWFRFNREAMALR